MSCIMRFEILLILLLFLFTNLSVSSAQEDMQVQLVKAEICEDVKHGECIYPTRILPVSNLNAYCYTSFDSITKPEIIYHKWYQRDELFTSFTLKLKPGSYSTVSSIQLKERQKGPWRVEIVDSKGRIFAILRFSIVD